MLDRLIDRVTGSPAIKVARKTIAGPATNAVIVAAKPGEVMIPISVEMSTTVAGKVTVKHGTVAAGDGEDTGLITEGDYPALGGGLKIFGENGPPGTVNTSMTGDFTGSGSATLLVQYMTIPVS